jgi:cytochrome bd-type quinol oxidase subunit 2
MSPESQANVAGRAADGVGPLLDSAFGFFVWAVHFLAVYVSTAIACQLGLGNAGQASRTVYATVLIGVTIAAAAIVVLHAIRRYRRDREDAERRFRLWVTVGCDTLATIAIAWQIFPLLLIPPCV